MRIVHQLWRGLAVLLFLGGQAGYAQETVVRQVELPGVTTTQEVWYSTSEADFEGVREEILDRLRMGDDTAFVNPADGPWMRTATTVMFGEFWTEFFSLGLVKYHRRQKARTGDIGRGARAVLVCDGAVSSRKN